MPYTVSFISLGCAKNQVNCEQMMAAVAAAGHTVTAQPEGSDVAVVNTCGFLTSACEEAIEHILEMGELKKVGLVKKILVTGCMAQRYQKDVMYVCILLLILLVCAIQIIFDLAARKADKRNR